MRRQAFDVLVVGPVVQDQLFVTKKAEAPGYGQTLEVKEVPVTLAGSGANIAVALARLGVKVGLVAAVGRDARGDDVVRELAAEGVDTRLVARVSLVQTGLSVTVLPEGGGTIPLTLGYQGANELVEVTEEVQKMLHTTQWLYLTAFSGAREAHVSLLLETLRQEPTKLAWHPQPSAPPKAQELITDVLARTDLLFVNEEDARLLTGSSADHEAVERALRLKGPKTVVMSRGEKEAHVLADHVHVSAPPPRASVRDPRGAGDAFRAAFLSGVLHTNGDVAVALQWALTNAASAVSSLTTQRGLLGRPVLEERLRVQRIAVEKSARRP